MRFVILVLIFLLVVGLVSGYFIHLSLGQESVAAWGSFLTGIGSVLLALAAGYAGLQALQDYRARSRTEKARWTTELFHKFYEEGRQYRRVRQMIDYDDLSAVFELIRRGEGEFSQEERDLFDGFTDYLNFFEFVAYLLEQRQLDRPDVRAMFEYYLTRIGQLRDSKELGDYIKNTGFERLHALLLEYGLKP